MVPMECMLALDAKGILPFEYETPEEYVHRGEVTLAGYADAEVCKKIIEIAVDLIKQAQPTFRGISWPAPECRAVKNFKKGIADFGKIAGADFSWLPIIAYRHNFSDTENARYRGQRWRSLGYSSLIPEGALKLPVPCIGVNVEASFDSYATGAHEVFHVVRKRFPRSVRLLGADEFEELGHLTVKPFRRFLAVTKQRRQFLAAWWQLRRAFGEHAMYVLARLSYDELVENILEQFNNRDPREYLEWAAKDGKLRYRIMAHRLGI